MGRVELSGGMHQRSGVGSRAVCSDGPGRVIGRYVIPWRSDRDMLVKINHPHDVLLPFSQQFILADDG